jgi:hypothetical protein
VVGQIPFNGQHTWLLWASSAINFTTIGSTVSIFDAASTAGTFAGTLRLAWMPNTNAAGAAATEAMLDSYVDAVPTGGSVTAWSNVGQTLGSYRLSWSTTSMTNPGAAPSQQLLMLALPHHIDTLAILARSAASAASAFPLGVTSIQSADATDTAASTSISSSTVYISSTTAAIRGRRRSVRKNAPLAQAAANGSNSSSMFGAYVMSVRGPMVPVVGSCWLLQEQLAPLTTDVQAAANLKNPSMRANIEQTLLVSATQTRCLT